VGDGETVPDSQAAIETNITVINTAIAIASNFFTIFID
jgi:hypothetical protein